MKRKLTARARFEPWANVSYVQNDEDTYDIEYTAVGSIAVGTTANCYQQCSACDWVMVSMAVGNGKTSDMAMIPTEVP